MAPSRLVLTVAVGFLVAAVVLVAPPSHRPAYAQSGGPTTTVYANAFEGGAGSEWSIRTTSRTPTGGRRFLGEFGVRPVSLRLASLPAHSRATIEFDLFILKGWTGNANPADMWDLSVANGPDLLRTTFANPPLQSKLLQRQAFPDLYPGGNHAPDTGAIEKNTLGYRPDAVYHLVLPFAHTASTLILKFASTLPRGQNATWGLDNVQVRVDASTTQAAEATRLPPPTDLPPGWDLIELLGNGINDAGTVVGQSVIILAPPQQGMGIAPVMWQNGQISRVPAAVNGSQSGAVDINNAGHVAGNDQSVLGCCDDVGWLVHDGVTTMVIELYKAPVATTAAVNELDHMAITQSTGPNGTDRAMLWRKPYDQDIIAPLSQFPAQNATVGRGLNDMDQLVGFSYQLAASPNPSQPQTSAFLFDHGQTLYLPPLGGANSIASGINNGGWACGAAALAAGGGTHAVIWRGGVPVDLGTLGGMSSGGFAINEFGQVIGASDVPGSSSQRAFLYRAGRMVDLTGLLGHSVYYELSAARAINNTGQIVCQAYTGYSGISTPVLVTLWAQNVTPSTAVTVGPLVKGRFGTTQLVTIRNKTSMPIEAPMSLVLDKLVGAHPLKVAGTTNRLAPAGSPYVNVPANPLLGLQPGMQMQVTLEYDRISLRGVSFTPRILAGTGLR